MVQKVAEADKVSINQAKDTVARTVYFATYFHPSQTECSNLIKQKVAGEEEYPLQNKLIEFAAKFTH